MKKDTAILLVIVIVVFLGAWVFLSVFAFDAPYLIGIPFAAIVIFVLSLEIHSLFKRKGHIKQYEREIHPEFDREVFCQSVKDIYYATIRAALSQDVEFLQPYMTEEFYHRLKVTVKRSSERELYRQAWFIGNVQLTDFLRWHDDPKKEQSDDPFDYPNSEYDLLKASVACSAARFTVDEDTDGISDIVVAPSTIELMFIRPRDGETASAAQTCPHCSAAITGDHAVCPVCGANIPFQMFGWLFYDDSAKADKEGITSVGWLNSRFKRIDDLPDPRCAARPALSPSAQRRSEKRKRRAARAAKRRSKGKR